MDQHKPIRPAQRSLGDMEVAEFRERAHQVADHVADYLERLESYRVLPDIEPGSIRRQLPAAPPGEPEPLEAVLEDYARLIEPNITHWQHPGFMAYFPSVACGPGILGEWLAAGLNSNVMFWRNAPASTELEEVVVGWLRQMLGRRLRRDVHRHGLGLVAALAGGGAPRRPRSRLARRRPGRS